MADKQQSARDAYRFLLSREGKDVSREEVAAATHGVWSPGTVGNYRSKKWKAFTESARPGRFRITSLSLLTEDEFVALQSQVTDSVIDPQRKIIADAITDGEGQTIEFKEKFPKNALALAQEVAALATSGGGTILIGVRDDGTVVGYVDSRERAEGIAKNVSPPPTMTVDMVPYEGLQVCLLRVAAGTEPVYYAGDKPYIRQGSSSRPATPDEVKAQFDLLSDRNARLRSVQRGTVQFGAKSLTADVTLTYVDDFRAELSFSPTNDVSGQLVSPTRLRFTRRSTSAPDALVYRVVERA